MPLRSFNRQQAWLLPPSLGDLVPEDHPARFVAEFVDGLEPSVWMELGIGLEGDPLGAPAYHPRALLAVWLYGFMTGVRSSRRLEAACRDQVPYLWLTGWQRPDHNTLWRFYQAHRQEMRRLLKCTVATAVGLDLVDLALQALDGTKIEANAAHDRTHDSHELVRLLDRTEKSILELEAMNESSDDLPPPRLPERLQKAQVLRQQVRNAMKRLSEDKAIKQTNLTDEDARLMKGRGGIIVGYNAQAMVSPIKQDAPERGGMMITAADVVCTASDCAQLVPMLKQAEKTTSKRAAITLADGGYHTAANLEAGERRSQTLVMTERYQRELKNPYFKDQFAYDDETDSYYCPCGHRLHFRGMRHDHRTSRRYRVYTASRTACRTCKAFGTCTKDAHGGRALWIGSSDVLIRRHRQWMETPEAHQLYARRQQLCEPVFGILKDRMAARKFLLRGLENVRAEFSLLATTFNLRTLCRFWGAMGNRKWVSIQQLDQQIAAILVTSGPTPVLA